MPPACFLCPLSNGVRVMVDPVIAADGVCYDRQSIQACLEVSDISPTTNMVLTSRTLTPNDALRSNIEGYLLSRAGQEESSAGGHDGGAGIEEGVPRDDLMRALRRRLGYKRFRPQQERVVQSCLRGRDNLVVMATGSGKSICYQMCGLVGKGSAVIISPLISLMQDQVQKMCAHGVAACFLGSAQADHTMDARVVAGEFALVYLTPEKLVHRHRSLPDAHLGVPYSRQESLHTHTPPRTARTAYVWRRSKGEVCAHRSTSLPRSRSSIRQRVGLWLCVSPPCRVPEN